MEYSYTNHNAASSAPDNRGSAVLNLQEERVRMAAATEEVKKEWHGYWEKEYANAEIFPPSIAAMHPDVVDFLLSFNLVSVYDDIAKQAGLDVKGRNILPHVIWEIAEKKNWGNLDQILESKIQLVHSAHMRVAQLLEQNILSKIRALSEKPFAKKTVAAIEAKKESQMSLAQALQDYPKLGEQNITNNPLKLRYFPTSVRPSIKNWMTDFHDNMGAGKHSAIDRGNYLFHSENGKKLTPIERQKLSAILKSLDEKSLLNIDPEDQTIVFTEQKINMEAKSPIGDLISEGKNNNEKLRNSIATEDNYFQIPKKETLPKNSSYSPNFVNKLENSFLSKQKSESAPPGNFKDFSNAGGKLSFSSPHKFPNEQNEETAENDIFQNAQRKTSETSQINKAAYPPKQPQSQAYWSSKPSSPYQKESIEDDQASQPKVKGNTVDLRG